MFFGEMPGNAVWQAATLMMVANKNLIGVNMQMMFGWSMN